MSSWSHQVTGDARRALKNKQKQMSFSESNICEIKFISFWIQLPAGRQNLGVQFSLVARATQEHHLFLLVPVKSKHDVKKIK